MERSSTRRTVLRTATLGGLAAVAGCASTGDGADPAPTGTATDESTGTEPTPSETRRTDASDLDAWLAAANVPDPAADRRFDESVVVTAGDAEVPYAFRPALVEVTPGTTVEWTWARHGGPKNVVAPDGTFDSGAPVLETRRPFRHTFEGVGTYRYVSEPQRDCGLRGVVVVSERPEDGYPTVDRWLADAGNYRGTVADRTRRDPAVVAVGARGNADHFAFDPPAIAVSRGTTVRWRWTGAGGAHSVDFVDVDASSGVLFEKEGVHLAHTFGETGVYRYFCRPHRSLGAKGAVVVVE